MDAILDFLMTRRSVSVKDLISPGPDANQLTNLLKIGARVPDHGRLVPWRFIIIEGNALSKLGECLAQIVEAEKLDINSPKLVLERERFSRVPLVICVVSRAEDHPKIPKWEQVLSVGAVCMQLLSAATAMGFGAQWLTEWCAYNDDVGQALGLEEHEKIAGFIYIGTSGQERTERVRPDLDQIITCWQQD
jgi:nitroreductase